MSYFRRLTLTTVSKVSGGVSKIWVSARSRPKFRSCRGQKSPLSSDNTYRLLQQLV